MSFGFSVGDFLAGAQLAYTLGKALSDSHGASKQYQELIAELHVVHKVMLQVQELHAAKQLSIATVNALLFTINATNGVMEAFLDEHERYSKSLKRGGSRNSVKDFYWKGRWATSMPEKVGLSHRGTCKCSCTNGSPIGHRTTQFPSNDARGCQLPTVSGLLL